ncbi:uncharacterized protein [Temnothorax longispinosus]|uniref:uncharacterized protein n=1 Tax=Temnothorax longispinosus TaxID=300112 RepID=UPI003A9A44C3
MPAEIDTGGHRVLHCDSRADCPTATLILRALTSANDERRADRAHLPAVRIDDNGSRQSPRRARKDRRRKTGSCVRKAEPLDRGRGNPSSNRGESSPTRVPRIGDKEETILAGRDFQATSRVLSPQPSHRRRGRGGGGGGGDEDEDGATGAGLFGACRASRESPRAIEDVTKDEGFSVTWKNPRENAGDDDEIARAESRLRDGTEGYRLAIVDTNGSSIAKRRSLRDRSWTRPVRPTSRESETLGADLTDRPGRTRTARGNSLLSSHRLRARAEEETYEDSFKGVDEGFFSEEFGSDDTWTDENGRTVTSGRRSDERSKNECNVIGWDSASRKRIGRACCVYPFLVFLLFSIVFGRCGLLGGASSVLRVNARPIANGLSVLGIGIIGAVNARSIDPIGDAAIRAERSANLSHMTGLSRGKIQMYIKNRHLQILPDGTVSGSNDDTSDYTIFHRRTTAIGQVTMQSMATCLFLCMDSCGVLYGSLNCTKACIFNETLEQHNYNTYISAHWSKENETLYIGMDRYGHPKKVIVTEGNTLGKRSSNVRVLTQVVSADRLEILQRRILGAHHKVRHWHHHCQTSDETLKMCRVTPPPEIQCRNNSRKKKKKRKRRCRSGEQPGSQCKVTEKSIAESVAGVIEASSEIVSNTTPESKRSCEGAASEEACRRQALSVSAKKRKSRIDGGGRNHTLGKNKAPTSNAKKPNLRVADNQSKKPDLTDGKKKRKRTTQQQMSWGMSTVASPSRKRYGPGTTSSSRVSLSLTAPASEEQWASTATLSSSPSLLGASTVLFSIKRPSSPQSDHKKPPPSSRNHIARPIGSRRIGKSSRDSAALPGRSRSISATSRSKIALLPSTTKVPEDTCAYTTTPLPQLSPVLLSSSLSWQESDDEDSSLVDEESSSIVSSELAIVTVESSTLAASDDVIAEVTTFSSDERTYEDSDVVDMIPQTTTKFPLERLAM